MYGLFSKPPIDADTVNGQLKVGESLEKEGKILSAYLLYKGLIDIRPDCKACRAHMGEAFVKLRNTGIDLEMKDNSTASTPTHC